MKRKLGLNIFLVVCIVGVSIYYSTGKGMNVFNGVLKSKNNIPIHSVDTEEKTVAITINTAYGQQFTDEILEVLDEENVHVSFFAMGSWIDKYEEDVKKIHKKDHEIGNNSLTYPHFTKISNEQIINELKNNEEKLEKVIGVSNKIFRPPFGDYNGDIVKTISSLGYSSIMWDVDSLDWSNKTEKEICETVLKQVNNGSIMLFHNNSDKTANAMKKIIKELKLEGYSFKKVSDLIYKDNFYIDHTGRQKKIDKM